MSVEAVWDLQTKSSPRCVAVYPAVVAPTTTLAASSGGGGGTSGFNPFDSPTTRQGSGTQQQRNQQQQQQQPSAVAALVFGTEHGSFHYRTYPTQFLGASSSSSSSSSSSGAAARVTGGGSGGSSHHQHHTLPAPVLPLGRRKGGSGSSASSPSSSNLPRHYYPMDLASLPGPVVQCLALPPPLVGGGGGLRQQQQRFLLLVDDSSHHPHGAGRSSSSSSSGSLMTMGSPGRTTTATTSSSTTTTFAALLVISSIATPGFQVVVGRSSQPPAPLRMSCATVMVGGGGGGGVVVYGTGRSLRTLPPDLWSGSGGAGGKPMSATASSGSGGIVSSGGSSSSSGTTTGSKSVAANFANTLLPAPGVRSGPDALLVTANNRAAVAAVGNSFYAVAAAASSPDDTTTTSTTTNSNNSNALLKLLSFQPSSQVHPAIVLDLHDPSLAGDRPGGGCWSSLFLASGRECAVVDLCTGGGGGGSGDRNDNDNNNNNDDDGLLRCTPPRHGVVTVQQSPIRAAAAVASWQWVAVLHSDGLISVRSPFCLAIALRTIEVGQRPNDYFCLRSIVGGQKTTVGYATAATSRSSSTSSGGSLSQMVAVSHSGACKVLRCPPDSAQDLADRLMRHCIDAFGPAGFPRQELAEAVGASFTATSYNSSSTSSTTTTGGSGSGGTAAQSEGGGASPQARLLLKQYLEAVLGLAEFESGARPTGWPTERVSMMSSMSSSTSSPADEQLLLHHGTFAGDLRAGRGTSSGGTSSSSTPAALLTGSALLCLVCSQLRPPDATLANRAAQAVSEKMGVVFSSDSSRGSSRYGVSKATVAVCELVAERLLREASSAFSLGTGTSPAAPMAVSIHQGRSSQSSIITDFIEAAVWLLRACGKHERAIAVASERLQQQAEPSASEGSGGATVRGFWSQIKYESYTATHLSELWSARQEEGCRLVLSSPATHRLLESNPRLGLSVFTAMHPQNEAQWRSMLARDDPLADPDRVYSVLKLLKSIHPQVPCDQDRSFSGDGDFSALPLESGRAVAVSFLRSAIGISTGRTADEDEFDTLPIDSDMEEHLSNFHDELSFLLLEGVIAERSGDDTNSVDTELGMIYRAMLRELLKWPLAKIRPEQFMESLPPTFLQEKALVLGRLNRHEDALRILYRDLESLDLALEYCDDRYAQQKALQERKRARQQNNNSMFPETDFHVKEEDNAYLPLVRVALESSEDTDRGTATAIKVLALRRSAIDRAAALRLLPSEVPVSAVARPFLIPALVDSESQVRRMTVVSALLRSRFLRLKDKLTEAQLKAQANIYVVPALKSLNLGDPMHSTKSFRVRTVSPTPGSTMPYIEIVKHFFPRHLVIQAKVTNVPYNSNPSAPSFPDSSTSKQQQQQPQTLLSDVAFVVAESSEEEAIQPLLQIPIQVLPPKKTGSAWCVLQAAPQNMDGPTAQLTCELRYAVQSVDAASALTASSSSSSATMGNAAVMARTFVEELQDLEVHAAHFS